MNLHPVNHSAPLDQPPISERQSRLRHLVVDTGEYLPAVEAPVLDDVGLERLRHAIGAEDAARIRRRLRRQRARDLFTLAVVLSLGWFLIGVGLGTVIGWFR